jgi:hypothetical protein
MTKPRIAISFSAGRSSARMSELVYERYSATHEIKACFVNTGLEDARTLEFAHACDEHIFGGKLTWLEAVINGPGEGPTAKVVTYETASRNGEPYEAAVAKYGVFNSAYKQCNSRLKTEPMQWWRASEGWAVGTYDTAVGIRADEIDRCSSSAKTNRIIYPLVDAGITKGDVNKWCSQFDWDLKLPGDHYGNCVGCFKKTIRKLMTVAQDDPSVFDFYDRMEQQYGHIHNGNGEQQKRRVFYRQHRSAKDIVRMSQTESFRRYSDADQYQLGLWSQDLDVGGGCGESCEVGADD